MQARYIVTPALMLIAFVLSSMLSMSQTSKSAPPAIVHIRVAYPLDVRNDHNLDFGWRIKGGTYSILATDPPDHVKETHVMIFHVSGEAGFHITVQFPLTTTLYRLGNPSLDQIPFERLTVIANGVYTQGSATLFLSEGTPSGTTTLPGILGQTDQPMTKWFWIGGRVIIPSTVQSSTNYIGDYTVTVTNYSV